ncbi:MAG TPA: transposase [Candidatus Korarchaeota archaeon]|nr:transposase [Candidatus Korarchaeota archaeon]
MTAEWIAERIAENALKVISKVTITKTIILPVSPDITKKKLNYIERLSARVTYAVTLYLDIIIKNDITKLSEANEYRESIARKMGLSSAFVQCARDMALEMYRSYKKLHKEWLKKVRKLEKAVEKAKSGNKSKVRKLEKKLKRLKERKPSLPVVRRKQPIFFDKRIGAIVFSNCRKFKVWAKISTLKKYETIYIPLITYPYADKHLKWKIKGFRLLYNHRLGRWEVHVTVEKEVKVHIKSYAGADLGMKRLAYIRQIGGENRVLSFPKENYNFFKRMHELNNRIAKLQRKGKTKALKRLKQKRRNVARDFRRKLAREIASQVTNTIIFVGHPKNVRDEYFKGNGSRNLRKRVNRWAFKEFGELLVLKLRENGNHAELIGESWSTKTCCICDSRNTIVNDRDFYCKDCNASIDRDDNGQANILKKGLKKKRVYEAVWPLPLQQLKAVTWPARPRRGSRDPARSGG